MAEYRAVVIEKPTLSEANKAILERCGFTDDYIATMPLDTLDLVIERIVDVAVLKQFGDISEEVLDSISYNLRLHKEVLLADAVANYASVPTADIVEATRLLVKNIETKVAADISLHTSRVENNFNNVAIYQESAAALGVYGVKLPEIQSSTASHSVQPEGKTRVDLSGTSMNTLRRAGAVAAVVGVIAVAGISPAQAQDAASPTSSSPATVEEVVVPTQPNSPEATQVPTASPEATDVPTVPAEPIPDTVPVPEQTPTTTAEPTAPPIVLGPPLDPIVITTEEIRPETDSSTLTKQEALPADTSLEEAIQNAEEEVSEETITASEVKETLVDELELVQDKILKAIKTGDITAFGEDTAFNRKDPADKSKVLQLTISKTHRAMLAKHMGDINRVLENDPEAIAKLMTFYAEKYANTEYAELNDQIAKFIVETRFTDGTIDLTMSQKILLMAIYTTVHEELVAQADAIYDKAEKEHIANTPPPAPIIIDSGDSNEKWDGTFVITPEVKKIINSWPIKTKKGKELALLIVKDIMENAEKEKVNPGIAIAKVMMETAWLSDPLSLHHNNFFGMKAGKNYKGKSVKVKTKEDYGNGLVTVYDSFRSHDTPAEGMQDFYELTKSKIYQDAAKHYLHPETYSYALLGDVDESRNIDGAQGQRGVYGWSTGKEVSYTEQAIMATYIKQIIPKHFMKGYDWSRETYTGSPLPKTIRGKIFYNQHDRQWALDPYRRSDSPRNYNVSTSGCMPSSLAIIVSNMTGKIVTPEDMVKLSLHNGFRTRDSGTSDAMVAFVAKKYGLKVKLVPQTRESFINVLQNGGMIMASGKDDVANTPGTSSGHIFTIDHVAIKGDTARFFTLDPNSTPNSFNNYSFSELSKDRSDGSDALRLAWAFYK